jgi:hypothetical protein
LIVLVLIGVKQKLSQMVYLLYETVNYARTGELGMESYGNKSIMC